MEDLSAKIKCSGVMELEGGEGHMSEVQQGMERHRNQGWSICCVFCVDTEVL